MKHKSIDIWKNYNYMSHMNDGFRPSLEIYILDKNTFDGKVTNRKRRAILICPGGGYSYTSEREAEPIAIKFLSEGFHAFILNYSVYPRQYPQSVLDLARAMSIIHENADEWNINRDEISICGFSAGAHLTATLGVYWNTDLFSNIDAINKEFIKPSKMILAYPVITSYEYAHRPSIENLLGNDISNVRLEEVSLEKHVNKDTPATFLWHTYEDLEVPVENSLYFANALRKNNIPFEMHIYPQGGHGLSLANEETTMHNLPLQLHVSTWFPLAIQWLKKIL